VRFEYSWCVFEREHAILHLWFGLGNTCWGKREEIPGRRKTQAFFRRSFKNFSRKTNTMSSDNVNMNSEDESRDHHTLDKSKPQRGGDVVACVPRAAGES